MGGAACGPPLHDGQDASHLPHGEPAGGDVPRRTHGPQGGRRQGRVPLCLLPPLLRRHHPYPLAKDDHLRAVVRHHQAGPPHTPRQHLLQEQDQDQTTQDQDQEAHHHQGRRRRRRPTHTLLTTHWQQRERRQSRGGDVTRLTAHCGVALPRRRQEARREQPPAARGGRKEKGPRRRHTGERPGQWWQGWRGGRGVFACDGGSRPL
mmetsp:Transcript_22114/g.54375  ORF Transcript_22114/g.54375 Transcript_22114/m.54375 type:complete len:206 (+) Transcript_22114:827-1444(+)